MIYDNRPFKIKLIPSRGDSVDSLIFYADAETASHVGASLARWVLDGQPGRAELKAMKALDQSHIEVAVIDRRNNTAVNNQIVRRA